MYHGLNSRIFRCGRVPKCVYLSPDTKIARIPDFSSRLALCSNPHFYTGERCSPNRRKVDIHASPVISYRRRLQRVTAAPHQARKRLRKSLPKWAADGLPSIGAEEETNTKVMLNSARGTFVGKGTELKHTCSCEGLRTCFFFGSLMLEGGGASGVLFATSL